MELHLESSTFIILFTFLLSSLLYKWISERKLPPGPIGLPIVGYLPFVGNEAFKTFSKLTQIYGNIFSLKMGTKLAIVLGDEKALKECFIRQGDIFAGRVQEFNLAGFFFDNKSIVVSDGPNVIVHRRFILKQLKYLGVGSASFEAELQNEIENFVPIVKNENGLDFEAKNLIMSLTINVICSLVTGQRFQYNDPKLEKLLNLLHEFKNNLSQIGILEFFTFLRFIPFKWTSLEISSNIKRFINEFFEQIIGEHEKTFNETNIRDLIDAYLIHLRKNPDDIHITRDYVKQNIILMFMAGVETSSDFLQWSFSLMAKYSDVQTKVREEIERVVGMNRFVSFTDRPNLPYLEATICEIHRFITIIPLGVTHCNSVPTTVFGYDIPLRTRVFVNLWHLHNDPKVWKEPEKFDPTRFLNEDGELNEMRSHIFPFSTGKRSCLGEGTAVIEFFTVFAAILQHFDLKPPQNTPHIIEPVNGATRTLRSCCIRFIPLS